MAMDIGNAYLNNASTKEKVYIIVGNVFGPTYQG